MACPCECGALIDRFLAARDALERADPHVSMVDTRAAIEEFDAAVLAMREARATTAAPSRGVAQESEAGESLRSQVDRLAAYILSDVPGEPSQSQGAIDTAIRVMGQSRSVLVARDAEIAKARGLIERAEAYLAAAVRLRTPREYPTVLLDDLRRYLGGA